jgi:hypothetical protein
VVSVVVVTVMSVLKVKLAVVVATVAVIVVETRRKKSQSALALRCRPSVIARLQLFPLHRPLSDNTEAKSGLAKPRSTRKENFIVKELQAGEGLI